MDLAARKAQLEQQKRNALESIEHSQVFIHHIDGALSLLHELEEEAAAANADAEVTAEQDQEGAA